MSRKGKALMRCSKCGAENPDRARFCVECAAPFPRSCPSCNAENPPTAKFCLECAKPLSAAAQPSKSVTSDPGGIRVKESDSPPGEVEGERKTVTALFADIKGSMDLMENLDPEEARAIVDPALNLMMDAVHHYSGYVAQSTGDGIFALFGAPIAHEDHPQRALYAALKMQEEMRRYSAKMRAAGNLPLEARVGVNTGEVVVRSIATGEDHAEYTPIGHSTSLAARMQALAPTGSIATTDATRKFCEGYFTFKSLGPTVVRGVSEPVTVHEVTGLGPLRTRLQRSAGRGLAKFVGRDREIEALRQGAEQAKRGHGQIVGAVAEPGVGKSRLFYEFKVKNQSGWVVLETFSVSHGKASAYLPLLDLLHGYFHISGEDDARTRREKVAGKITVLDRSLEDVLPHLFALLGIVEGEDLFAQMDANIRKRRTLESIKRVLLRESLNQPLMVIFEDLHWIDEQTQEFLNLLADSIGTAKILLLTNYRPEYSHQWGSKTYYIQLRLDPLGKESADEMLSALLGDGAELAQLKRLIIEKTEGNPFFMEETVQVLLDDGALVRNGGTHLTKPLGALKIPPTVQAILGARIDRLPSDAKDLLQMLSVIGREFPLSLIRVVVSKADDELSRLLNDLQLGEFVYEQPAAGGAEYVFKHALTQEVAYNSVLIERRKLLHERAGIGLESMFAGQLDDHLGELAHHYSHSNNVSKAVEFLGRAGQQALQRSAYADALRNLSAALDLLPKLPDTPERARRELLLQLALGPTLMAVKGWAAPQVEQAYTRMRQLCELLDDTAELFPSVFGLWVVHLIRGELPKAYEIAEQLLRLGESTHDPALQSEARHALGSTSYWMGKFPSTRENVENVINLYDHERNRPLIFRYGWVDVEVRSLCYASLSLWQLGYPDQAFRRANEALALAQRLSHPFSLTFAQNIAGTLDVFRREVRAVHETAESMLTISVEHGLTNSLAFATVLRGWALAEQGRYQEGIAQIQEGLEASRAIGAKLLRPYHLYLLAQAYKNTGCPDDALAALREALAIADEHEIRAFDPEIHRLKGELLLKQNGANAIEAQNCFERAIEIARKQGGKSWELRAATSLARLLATQGHRDEARAMLAAIYGWFTEGFDTADLKDAKALLAELSP
jgi:predicted ATPase/class 3 adenylate cyclase